MKLPLFFQAWLISFLFPLSGHSALVQILHTNDLHASFESYPALKTTVERLRNEASRSGIETILLDAGDFIEGSEFYFADFGISAWSLMNQIGYDAVTIGNHDWLIGERDLSSLLRTQPPTFAFLGANFSKFTQPYTSIVRSGIKIAVLGLTTDDKFFKWRLKRNSISNYISSAKKILPYLNRTHDFVIALTHLGIKQDEKLVSSTRGIDLVVGGHNHKLLRQPQFLSNRDGKIVPVLQVETNGKYVGKMLLDLHPDKSAKFVHYEVVPITIGQNEDPKIRHQVDLTYSSLKKRYGGDFFETPLLETQVALGRKRNHDTPWSRMVTEAMLEAGEADLSIDIPQFSAADEPPGFVTPRRIMRLYPRTFSTSRPFGWTVWTVKVRGWILKAVVKEAVKRGYGLATSGLDYEVVKSKGKTIAKNFRIRGKAIKPWNSYRLALPEGIARASGKINPLFRVIFKDSEDTLIPIWDAVFILLNRCAASPPCRFESKL